MDAARRELGVAVGVRANVVLPSIEAEGRHGAPTLIDSLPKDLSALNQDGLRHATSARDDRLSVLFRRWPSLSKVERKEARKLHEERLRLAKYIGMRRKELARTSAPAEPD